MLCRMGFHNWEYDGDRRCCVDCERVQEATSKAWCAPWRDIDLGTNRPVVWRNV